MRHKRKLASIRKAALSPLEENFARGLPLYYSHALTKSICATVRHHKASDQPSRLHGWWI